MEVRSLQLGLLLAALALALMACAGEAPVAERPDLQAEIPPCTPVEGATVDPCEPDAPQVELGSAASLNPGPKPYDLRFYMEGSVLSGHLVIRGTYLPDTVRCENYKVSRSSRGGEFDAGDGLATMACYVDIRVNAYVLGSGPATLTAMVVQLRHIDPSLTDPVEQEFARSFVERVLSEGGSLPLWGGAPDGGLGGREEMMFIGPSKDRALDSWQIFTTWDVERRQDGTIVAVHPWRNYWAGIDYETHKAKIEMPLSTFKTNVATTDTARRTDNGGRIKPDGTSPMFISTVAGLATFYVESGDANRGPMATPPPPCGKAVLNYLDNHGLVLDCITLLAAKDALRGTATLNWSVDTAIGSWHGVTVTGTPQQVTKLELATKSLTGSIPAVLGRFWKLAHLDLSDNSLTGTIPVELGLLRNLRELRLSGNSLTGCIPVALQNVATNDLDDLGLPDCG